MTTIAALQASLQDDKLQCTPDLPRLRYHNEDVYVFLFDQLTDSHTFRETFDLSAGCDFTQRGAARTALKYLPWYDLMGQCDQQYFCLDESLDLSMVELPEDAKGDCLPIRGTVYKVSLPTLLKLDVHYQNCYDYTRELINVKSLVGLQDEIECFTYMNWLEDFCDYHSLKGIHQVREDVSLYPFSIETDANEGQMYSYC